MHKFLRAVGFSKITTQKEVRYIIKDSIKNAVNKSYISSYEEGDIFTGFVEYGMDYAPGIGIGVRGELTEDDEFFCDYYFPYLRPETVSTVEDITIERHMEKLSYAGVVDDYKVGVSIIFYLLNIIPYMIRNNFHQIPAKGTTLSLAGLSTSGKILLPIDKNEDDIRRIRRYDRRKSQMIDAAKHGDEDAIESLTIADMDTYTVLQKRIPEEDILSLVETYFIPYGVECDLYSILGEILKVEKVTNSLTQEQIYKMTLSVNNLEFEMCINEIDLQGEPEVGRRFKGVIWLQGYINFPC